jgi:hypothetical protein
MRKREVIRIRPADRDESGLSVRVVMRKYTDRIVTLNYDAPRSKVWFTRYTSPNFTAVSKNATMKWKKESK